jgi:APA family basic amino acid/polyamine antiporter
VLTVAIKVLPLVAVVVILGLRWAGGRGAAPLEPLAPMPLGIPPLATAVALTFAALTGFENATTPVGKVRDPARTIPRAIMGGTLAVAVLYLFASTAVQLLLPAAVVEVSPAPVAEAIMRQWGSSLAMPAAIAIAIAAFGCLNGLVLGTGELGYAMGIRRDLPAFMAWTWRGNTPVGSQLVGAGLGIALILAGSSSATTSLYAFIFLVSTAAVLVVYGLGAVAAWAMSPTIGARAAIVVALLFVAFALYGSGLEPDLWCLALLAVGVAVRAVMHLLAGRSVAVAEGEPA